MSDVYLWENFEKVGRDALERLDYQQAIEAFRSAVAVAEKLQGEEVRLVMSLRHLSSATAKAGQLSLAYDLLGRTEEIAITRLGGTHSETVQVKRDLYELARQLGHLDQAESYLVEVLGVVRAHGETEEFLEILELLAQLEGERERLDNAAVLYQQIVDARATLYGQDHPSVAQALLWWSTALSRSGQAEAAEAPLARAFSMLEKQFADDPKSLAQSLLAGAELMTTGGRPAAALEHQKRALELLGTVVEEGHQSLWDTREMIASTLASMGRLEESIELLEYCLKNRQARDHRTGAMLKNLAGLYLSLQRTEQAEALYSQASDLLQQTLGPDHPAYLATLEERIQLYHFTGRPQEALDLALTTIRPTEQRFGAGHPNTAQVYASTALLAHAARKWDVAYELMKAAEAIWESLTPRPADVLSNCRLNQATCLAEMGRTAEAALALQKVQAAPGSPQEGVVRDLWARLEKTPASAPSTPAEPRRSVKLAFGGAFARPPGSVREPEHSPANGSAASPATAPVAQPEEDYPPPVGRPIWAAREEPVPDPTGGAPAAHLDNPFEDITLSHVNPQEDLDRLQREPDRPSSVAEQPGIDRLSEDFDFDLPDVVSELPNRSEPPAPTVAALDQAIFSLDGETDLFDDPFEDSLAAAPAAQQADSSQAVLWDDLPRQSTMPAALHHDPQIPELEIPEHDEAELHSPPESQSDEPIVTEQANSVEMMAPADAVRTESSEELPWDPEDSDDRREFQRFNLALNRFFELSLINERQELIVIRSFLVDLSAGGLRVNSERPLPLGETFQLSLPAELIKEELKVPARVSWQKPLYGTTYIQGVEFLELAPNQKQVLESALAEGKLQPGGRQHFRLYRPFPIQLSQPEQTEWLETYATDLSIEGLGTRLSDELRTGQTVRLRLGLEFEFPTVEVAATVAWSRHGSNGVSHGLRFDEVGPVEARTIKLYIDRCLELAPD